MSGAIVGGAVIGVVGAGYAAKQGAKGAEDAANISAEAQGRSLEYLKEVEAAPRHYRETALSELAGFYGIPGYDSGPTYTPDQQETIQRLDELKAKFGGVAQGGRKGFMAGVLQRGVAPEIDRLQAEVDSFTPIGGASQGGQQQFVDSVRESPFYESMRREGAESVGRYASMTGGLRSGNAVSAFAKSDQSVLQNLTNQRIQGLSGMASLPSYAPEIAGITTGIGATQAAGIMGAAQAQQAGYQGIGNAITGGIGNYLKYKQPSAANAYGGYGSGEPERPAYESYI